VERVGVDYYGGEPFFTKNWKSQAIQTFYMLAKPEAPLFDVCSVVCDTPPEVEESALGWRIADINHISYLQARAAQ
jgi:hypothetical protein